MRFSSIVAAGVVVVVVAVVVFVALGGTSQEEPGIADQRQAEPLTSPIGNGQFLQEIPHEADGDAATPAVALEEALGSPSPAASAQVSGQASITMSESGFSPATLNVKLGTAVTFVNNGQAAHWPASDVHPTHAIVPDFDAMRGLATGESYSYTFTKAGVWHCHDHLMPQNTCTITVTSDQ